MGGATIRLAGLTLRERAALRELLIRATSVAGRSSNEAELERLVGAVPVGTLPEAAALHGVAGCVLGGLEGVGGVPHQVRDQLASLRQRSLLHHLLVVGALGRIGRAFDDADLGWVVMKGPVAAMLYPQIGDRSYGDLDLLVARRHFPLSMRILEDLGYEHRIHNWALAEEAVAGQVQMTDQSIHVDLHWHLHFSRHDRRSFALDPEAMIERRRRVAISGVTVSAMDPVDTLLTLAFHAARSDGHRLVWFKDVERAVAVDKPDLEELVRRSRTYRCAPPVGVILSRARRLLGAEVPKETVRAMVPAPLLAAEGALSALYHPVQLHDRATITRVFTRSLRSSAAATVAAVPARGARRLRRQLRPPPEHETDSPIEKQRYLNAVSASTRP